MSVHTQHKWRRYQLTGSALATVTAMVLTATPAVAQDGSGEPAPQCELRLLPKPAESPQSLVAGMDPTGSYIVGRSYPPEPGSDWTRQALIWHDGEMTRVDMPGEDQNLQDVNIHGVAVGSAYIDGGSVPYVYRNGRATRLPGDVTGQAFGINARGDIIGDNEDGKPLLWPAIPVGMAKVIELELPEGAESGMATSIDSDGTIVGGYTDTATGNILPYVWTTAGTGWPLKLPPEIDPADHSGFAVDISEGWVLASLISMETWEPVTLRWHLPDGAAEAVDVDYGDGINQDGSIAGVNLETSSGPDTAVLLTDSGRTDLPRHPKPHEEVGDQANAISGDGTVIAGTVTGIDVDGQDVMAATLWSCG